MGKLAVGVRHGSLGEIDDFYNRMGLDPIYFDLFTPTQIAKHIHSFIAAKKVGVISQTPENLRVEMVTEEQVEEEVQGVVGEESREHNNNTPREAR